MRMRVFHDFEGVGRISRPVATIGSFDGVHSGHRKILARIGELACARNGESVVITFEPHPRLVLGDESVRLLTTLDEKLALLDGAGVDNTVVVRFTPEFSRLTPLEFVERDLVERLHVDTLLVGYDHHVGHDQSGDPQTLSGLSRRFGFDLQVMPPQTVDSDKVSSTVIRRMIERGDVKRAAHFLQSDYRLTAEVDREGRLSGVDPYKLLPASGTYSVIVFTRDGSMHARLRIESSDTMRFEPLLPIVPGGKVTVDFVDLA